MILYRMDGKVDVYHQPTLTLDPKGYQIAAGLGEMVACHFEWTHFEIRPQGLDGDPFIAFWNLEVEGPLPGAVVDAAGLWSIGDVRYTLVKNAGHHEIAAMARAEATTADRPARGAGDLQPILSGSDGMRNGVSLAGTFRITVEPAPEAGEVDGEWQVARQDDQVRLRLRPSEGWQPGEPDLMPRLIFTLVRPFKQWPKSYE